MTSQLCLIPVSPAEFRQAAYELALMLQQKADAEEDHKEAQKAHKETMAVLNKGIAERVKVLRRAQQEQDDGLLSREEVTHGASF